MATSKKGPAKKHPTSRKSQTTTEKERPTSRKTQGKTRRPRSRAKAAESAGRDKAPLPVSLEEGVLIAKNPELFRHGLEALCSRLADTAVGQKDVRSVSVCLESGTCRLEFERKANDSEVANRFAEAIRTAASEWSKEGRPSANGGSWSSLMEFAVDGHASRWEMARPDQHELRLRNPVICKDRGLARRVARGLAHAPGVAACRATWWERELEVRFDPDKTSADQVVSAAEAAFRRALGRR
jgi:hypothetical protein